jgi:hypothetical protein
MFQMMTYGMSYTTIGRNIGQKMVLPLIHLGLDAIQHLKCFMSFVIYVCG